MPPPPPRRTDRCPTTSRRSRSTCRRPSSTTWPTACAAPAGPRPRPSTTGRRASRSRTSQELCALLGRRLRLAGPRERAQPLPAVPHRDRRPRHPLPARALAARRTPCRSSSRHGWPGSIVEFHKVIGRSPIPTAHGGDAADAFHVVCPSLPGYGFSDKPTAPGWGVDRIAAAWADADGPPRLRPLRARRAATGARWSPPRIGVARRRAPRRHPPQHADRRSPTVTDDLTDAGAGRARRR